MFVLLYKWGPCNIIFTAAKIMLGLHLNLTLILNFILILLVFKQKL